jgi:hypothetical protein
MDKNEIKDLHVESEPKFKIRFFRNNFRSRFLKIIASTIILIIVIIFLNRNSEFNSGKIGCKIEMLSPLNGWEKIIDVYGYANLFGADLDYWYAIKIAEFLYEKHKKPYRVTPSSEYAYMPIQTFDGRAPLNKVEKKLKLITSIELITQAKNSLHNSSDHGTWRSLYILKKIKFIKRDYSESEEYFRAAIKIASDVIFSPCEGDHPEDGVIKNWITICESFDLFDANPKNFIIEEMDRFEKTLSDISSKIDIAPPDQ